MDGSGEELRAAEEAAEAEVADAWRLYRKLVDARLSTDRWSMSGGSKRECVSGFDLVDWWVSAHGMPGAELTRLDALRALRPLFSHGLIVPLDLKSILEASSRLYRIQAGMAAATGAAALTEPVALPPDPATERHALMATGKELRVPPTLPAARCPPSPSAHAAAAKPAGESDSGCDWRPSPAEIAAGRAAACAPACEDAAGVSPDQLPSGDAEEARRIPPSTTPSAEAAAEAASSPAPSPASAPGREPTDEELCPGRWAFEPPLGLLNCVYAFSGRPRPPHVVARCLQRRALAMVEAFTDEAGLSVNYRAMRVSQHLRDYAKAAAELQCINIAAVAGGGAYAKAFFLNLYNAMVCHGLCAFGKAPSCAFTTFFDRVQYRVGPWRLSLNDIEHGVLRGNRPCPGAMSAPFGACDSRSRLRFLAVDPRVHFALVCGARSCPAIRIYCPYTVDSALDGAVSAFLTDEANLDVDPSASSVRLSKLLCWYRRDFAGATHDELLRWLLPYMPAGQRASTMELLGEALAAEDPFASEAALATTAAGGSAASTADLASSRRGIAGMECHDGTCRIVRDDDGTVSVAGAPPSPRITRRFDSETAIVSRPATGGPVQAARHVPARPSSGDGKSRRGDSMDGSGPASSRLDGASGPDDDAKGRAGSVPSSPEPSRGWFGGLFGGAAHASLQSKPLPRRINVTWVPYDWSTNGDI